MRTMIERELPQGGPGDLLRALENLGKADGLSLSRRWSLRRADRSSAGRMPCWPTVELPPGAGAHRTHAASLRTTSSAPS